MNSEIVKTYLIGPQNSIVQSLGAIENKPFITDAWQRTEGGGGRAHPSVDQRVDLEWFFKERLALGNS